MSPERCRQLLRDMVEIPSPSGHEGELARFLVREMADLGFRSWVDEAGNAVGELGDGPQEVLLLGHMDTVPGDIPVRITGGKLYGRGSVDAKGPLAAFICAAAQEGPRPSRRWVVVGAVEEEAATSRGARHLLGKRQPSAVIVGEPSRWNRITVGYKGRLLVEYRLCRPMGHTAGPEAGVVESAVDFWLAVRDYAAAHNKGKSARSRTLDATLRIIQSADDGLTQQVEVTIALRLPLGLQPAAVRDAIQQTGAPGAEVTFHGEEVAFRAPKDTRLVAALLTAIRDLGGEPRFSFKTGTSDMNVVGPVWKCPIVAYGPGDPSLDHTPNEHIELEEYETAIAVLANTLQTL
jgi:LysW-gamma-L-lysine carboxypeptidase